MGKRRIIAVAAASLLVATFTVNATDAGATSSSSSTVQRYGWRTQQQYDAAWAAPYGPGDGTVTIGQDRVTVRATPFTLGADQSVFDHLKYIRISTASFPVPAVGSLEFQSQITAATTGTDPGGRVIHGCQGVVGWDTGEPCATPWSGVASEAQQAGVVMNMINFETGQLFDWFVSSHEVFALIERLPSTVTGSPGVNLDKAYTQIIKRAPITPGKSYKMAIRYTRGPGVSRVEYFMNGRLFAEVDHVGIPLDTQGVPFTGYAASVRDNAADPGTAPGEELSLDSFQIGHGLFSLLDAYPYQHPSRPDLAVSIPLDERLFGQGAVGSWGSFMIATRHGRT